MDVRLHPNQPGYIITFPNGVEYATQEGDQYYAMADAEYNNPSSTTSTEIDYEVVEEPINDGA